MLSFYCSVVFLILRLQNSIEDENPFFEFKSYAENNVTYAIERFKTLWPVSEWKENGFFSEECISNVNVHWLSFAPPNKSSFFILGVTYLVIMVFGFLGNFFVIFLYIRCKSLHTPANKLIINLAASDGVITLNTPIFIYNSFHLGPALGDKACRLYGFLGGLSGTVSIVTLSAISFDRYFVIKFPLNRSYSNLRIKICLIIVWLYGFIFSIIPALDIGLGKYTYEGYLTSCSFDYLTDDTSQRIFIIVFCVAAWLVPLVLITFCYATIVRVVSVRSSSCKNERDSFRHVKQEMKMKEEVKLAVIVLFTICLWFVAWTPYAVVAMLGIFKQKQLITPLSSMIPAVFCKIASCINPFVYALSHPKFKLELKNIFCRSMRTTRDNRKIWSTDLSNQRHFESYKDTSDVEEEFVEVNLKTSRNPMAVSESFDEPEKITTPRKKIYAEAWMELICLRPTFSNKSSRFRKMVRGMSTINRESKLSDGD